MTTRRALLAALLGLPGLGSIDGFADPMAMVPRRSGLDDDRHHPETDAERRQRKREAFAELVRANRRPIEDVDLPDRRRECRACGGLAELEVPGRVRCWSCGHVETFRN